MISNKKEQKEKGITLIALVITIVILIILATVTINMAFGDNGLVKYAEEARDKTANSTIAEAEGINSMVDQFANVLADDSENPIPDTRSEIEKARDEGTKYTQTTPLKDDLENTVYIPGGFHVSKDSATKVEGGIVIEDDDGNQFVWIPTGEYKVTNEVDSDGTKDGKMTNALSRRAFTSSGATIVSGDSVISSTYYGEGDSRSVASSQIGAFLSSAKPVSEGGKGGFYIGRYESGTETERTATTDPLTIPLVQANKEAYVYVTRDEAKTQAEAMYSGKSDIKVTSQLISSYAWDTVLNYICQTNTAGYTLATTTSSSYGNIGTSNKTQTGAYTQDNYSNIHDFLGNCYEWTTEYSSYSSSDYTYPCALRGGGYLNSGYYVASHNSGATDYSDSYRSFRLQLYV